MKLNWSFSMQLLIIVLLIILFFMTGKNNIKLCAISGIGAMATNIFYSNKYTRMAGSIICITIFIYLCLLT